MLAFRPTATATTTRTVQPPVPTAVDAGIGGAAPRLVVGSSGGLNAWSGVLLILGGVFLAAGGFTAVPRRGRHAG